ncbi:mechanosensitive ion channel domain-containing protein [Aquimarina sp. 2-A2]|uniref:mechanosensitive ion channel domain-containing protein n=1 Tax=Aquimarina sp. 2-A2 TaxID=3382644 RepID=UPI00387F14AE
MNLMIYKEELVYTLALICLSIAIILITKRAIKKFTFVRAIEVNRRKVIFNLAYLLTYLITGTILAIIWGVDIKQFSVFISSILAVLGVGFFAQWSILSNLTSSVILFFNHPVRIGDRVRILDKDFDWTGIVQDITGFYFFMQTDKGENISLPNSLVMQKGIQILDKEEMLADELYAKDSASPIVKTNEDFTD